MEELKRAASAHDRDRASLTMARTRLAQATTDLDRLRFENEVSLWCMLFRIPGAGLSIG